MRIISGKYRGRKLISPLDNKVRPTTDMVKEAIYDVIQFRVSGSNVLDLFAGSGALGIEAISRGAGFVYFVDNSKDSISLLNKNLDLINEKTSFKVLFKDFKTAIFEIKEKSIDIVFLDPPYNFKEISEIFKSIKDKGIMSDNAIIVYEHDCAFDEQILDLGFEIYKEKRYGSINVTYLKDNGR